MNISVIGVSTPAQVSALQAATGMEMRISRNGAYLATKDQFTGLMDCTGMDAYELTDALSWSGQMGTFPGDAA